MKCLSLSAHPFLALGASLLLVSACTPDPDEEPTAESGDTDTDSTGADTDSTSDDTTDSGTTDSGTDTSSETGSTPTPSIFGPDDAPYGKTYAEWNVEWWQWVLSIPRNLSPIEEGDCAQGQAGEVWFLAGNSGGESQRECTIPAQTPLLFPILNAYCNACPEVFGIGDCSYAEEQAVIDCISDVFDYEHAMTLTIDGVEFGGIEQHIAEVTPFPFSYEGEGDISWGGYYQDELGRGVPSSDTECLLAWEEGNVCMEPAGPRTVSGGGWYVMVEALAPGEHELNFTGSIGPAMDPYFSLDVSYSLTVE